MERPDIDVIDICTPGDTHAQIAIAALDACKHMGTSWDECVRIAFVVPEKDLPAGRLDRVRVVYETA